MAGGWGPSIKSRAFAPDRRVSTVVVQLICNQKVGGSNPSPGTTPHPPRTRRPGHLLRDHPRTGRTLPPARRSAPSGSRPAVPRAGCSLTPRHAPQQSRETRSGHAHIAMSERKPARNSATHRHMTGLGRDRLPAPGHVSGRPARRHRHPVRPSPHPVRPALPWAGIATATPAPWRSPVAVPVPSPPSRLEPGSHRSR